MKFFIDTANIQEIKELIPLGIIDGVTTNPSLIAASNRDIFEVLDEICNLVNGPISAEVTATDCNEMIKEAQKLIHISEKIVIKVPLTKDGLQACSELRNKDINVNVTLCFSPSQALLAAKCGATYISPFIGRLDDISHDGMQLIQDIRSIYDNYPEYETQILAASLRHPNHLVEAALVGADVSTLPPSILHKLFKHPLTDIGLKSFLDDWKKSKQTINTK
ncbi:MAG: Transaldolase [Alphaproteobacteria bacterium MarineAlpha2_Bin1]|nr:MAG: Transaldolase [Alphaproteobacteria bacterium MarineAlpha2_Bin1]|tara:strand:- start:2614 stop:3276 length:663 start_codon:yes stop_codon:yes gene_type:complete